MFSKIKVGSAIALFSLVTMVGVGNADATVLTGNLSADNSFTLYISTDNNTLGTQIASGGDWETANNGISPYTLAAGSTYYLHIVADNQGGPANGSNPDALIGQFNLSDAGFKFGNGTQVLLTDTSNWAANDSAPSSWSAPSGTPISFGANSDSSTIWYSVSGTSRPNIDGSADWIWSSPNLTGEAFFSATISSAVPEISTWAMMILGFCGLGLLGYRRRRSATVAA